MPIPDDFAPDPTLPTGGLGRMLQIWEALRDSNTGGYGDSVLRHISGWGTPSPRNVTSCSQFTATCIGMMFDPGGAVDAARVYAPVINVAGGQLPLPVDFYRAHNGFNFTIDRDDPSSADKVAARKKQFHDHGWTLCDDSVLSTAFFNLGYRIDPRDIRRGDLLGIDWANGHGHATFAWNVHTSTGGAVDCLQFVSANGYGHAGDFHGPGVSVSAPHDAAAFIAHHADGTYTKKFPLFVDNDLYITGAYWYCLPGVALDQVDRSTFGALTPPDENFVHAKSAGHSCIGQLRALRFWGFAPPETRHGTILTDDQYAKAKELCKWPTTPPVGVTR
jgi:hypothetical protein